MLNGAGLLCQGIATSIPSHLEQIGIGTLSRGSGGSGMDPGNGLCVPICVLIWCGQLGELSTVGQVVWRVT